LSTPEKIFNLLLCLTELDREECWVVCVFGWVEGRTSIARGKKEKKRRWGEGRYTS